MPAIARHPLEQCVIQRFSILPELDRHAIRPEEILARRACLAHASYRPRLRAISSPSFLGSLRLPGAVAVENDSSSALDSRRASRRDMFFSTCAAMSALARSADLVKRNATLAARHAPWRCEVMSDDRDLSEVLAGRTCASSRCSPLLAVYLEAPRTTTYTTRPRPL